MIETDYTDYQLKNKLINKVLDLGLFLSQEAGRLIDKDFENIIEDYNKTLNMYQEKEVPNEDGDRTYHQEEYIGAVLDGHMDTLIKTVLNLIVSSITEVSLEENKTPVDLPDIVDYIVDNKEHYNLA